MEIYSILNWFEYYLSKKSNFCINQWYYIFLNLLITYATSGCPQGRLLSANHFVVYLLIMTLYADDIKPRRQIKTNSSLHA